MISQLTVLVINHSEILLIGLKYMILNIFNNQSVSFHEASSIQEGIKAYADIRPHLIIIDQEELVKEDKTLTPYHTSILSSRPIIVLSDSSANFNLTIFPGYAIKGILSKSVKSEELGHAIKQVLAGECHTTSILPANDQTGIITNIEEKVKLTKREKEILHLVTSNLSSKEISQKLFLSERTIETHRYNLQKKLKTANIHLSVQETYSVRTNI